MALYPSLEDMKVDQLLKAQVQVMSEYSGPSSSNNSKVNSTAPSAPCLDDIMDNNSHSKYPSLGEYMGLELTYDVIAANMPEYLNSSQCMQVMNKQQYPLACTNSVNKIVAPLSSHSQEVKKAFVTNGIRELTLAKDKHGKIGLRVEAINNGVFINFVKKNSPAAMGGLRFGDQILEINEKSVAGLSMDAVHAIIKKAQGLGITFVIRDRPFDRTVILHKDSTGHVGFSFKDGKIVALVIDSSAARNGLLTDHNLLEVNGQTVVGLKDKEIMKIISEAGDIITVTIIPSFLYQHMTKRKGKNAVQARKKLTHMYGEGVLAVRHCQMWFAKFRSGNFDVKGVPRSGRPVEAD